MLQPLQIEEVSGRYASEITELREFLFKAGLTLDRAETLHQVTMRLRDDRAFRRDLTSHAWVVLHASGQQIRHADLLAMLAVAAVGPRLASDAADAEAHDLLRFVMQVWNSFDAVSGSQQKLHTARPVASVVPSSPQPRFSEHDVASTSFLRGVVPQQESALSLAMPEDADDRRRMLWIGAAAACVLLVLAIGVLFHRSVPVRPTAPEVSTDAPVVESPSHVLANKDQVQRTQQSEARTPAVRETARSAPYSSLPESSLDLPEAAISSHVKPSPVIPMAASRPSMASVRPTPRPYPRSPHTPPAAKPAAVAGSDSVYVPKAVPVETLNLRGGPASAGTTRQAVVRPTSLGIMAANVTYSPAPAYPATAAAARVQGEVKLEAEVGRDGTVESTRIISGPPLLADAAANAVQHWRYRPYLYAGKPIAMNAQIVMDFQLP